MFKVIGILVIIACGAYAATTLCGVKENDEKKTCISIRLPWQEDPIYFCTENKNIRYKDRCMDRLARYCPSTSSNKSLLIATPWDCCALTSTPDYCADVHCPSKPFNRTCTESPADARTPYECCPTYFCEDGKISNCQLKRLQPGCMTPPKNKTNCVAFRDEHGCCNKYQCEGEGKPGMCPKQVEALALKRMMDTTSSSTSRPLNTNNLIDDATNATMTGFQAPGRFAMQKSSHITTDIRCVGDYNCPGQMKCCSHMASTYIDYDSKNTSPNFRYHFGNYNQAVYGYCMEPVNASESA